MNYRSLLLSGLVLFGSAHLNALSKKSAWLSGTAIATAVTFLSSRYLMSGFFKNAALFAGTEYLAVELFLSYTPENRYKWAVRNLGSAQKDLLFEAQMSSDSFAQIMQMAGCESYELPLVKAFLRLQFYDRQLVYMLDELQAALTEQERTSLLAEQIDDLIMQIKIHLVRIRANEAFVKNQPNWIDQWRLYQERVLAKEKLDHLDYLYSHAHWHVRVN